jgi:hypothetical protein
MRILYPQMMALGVFAAATTLLAASRFRKRLD